MTATGFAAEVTSAIRDLGSEIELQGRALGSSARRLVTPNHLVQLIVTAADASAAMLTSAARPDCPPDDVVIVDRTLTRC